MHPRTANSSLPSHPDFYGCGSCLARLRIGDAGRWSVYFATIAKFSKVVVEVVESLLSLSYLVGAYSLRALVSRNVCLSTN